MEQAQSRQSENQDNRESISQIKEDVNINNQVLTTESDIPEMQDSKKQIPKVDAETLKKRIEEDKEIATLTEEKERIINLIEESKLENIDEEEFKNEAYNLIQCHDPNRYRKRIVGFVSPFGPIEKGERIGKEEKSRRYKFKSKEDKEQIKARIKEIKTQREIEKKKKDQEKEEQYQKHRSLMKNIHYKLQKGKDGETKEGVIAGYQLKSEDQIFDTSNSKPAIKLGQLSPSKSSLATIQKQPVKLPNKFTLETLGQFKYEDLAGDENDQFNLGEFVDENNDGFEDEILKRYRLEEKKINRLPVSPSPIPDQEDFQPFIKNNKMPKGITNRVRDVIKEKVINQRTNNSVSKNEVISIPKTLSKRDLIIQPNSKSKKNLLAKSHEVSSIINRKGPTSDDEKIYKNKLVTKSNKKIELSNDAKKSDRRNYKGYPSQSPQRNNDLSIIPKSVKKSSNKISFPLSVINNMSNKPNLTSIKASNLGIVNQKIVGNITMDTYDRANKMESKAKKSQEERLQNILKMHDNNVKRGVGVANKGRIL